MLIVRSPASCPEPLHQRTRGELIHVNSIACTHADGLLGPKATGAQNILSRPYCNPGPVPDPVAWMQDYAVALLKAADDLGVTAIDLAD